MWVRRTPTGFRLTLPLEVAGWIVALGLTGVSGLVIYAAFVVSPIELIWFPLTTIPAFAVARSARQHVDVLDEGIQVANTLRTTWIRWSDFTAFSVGRWRAWRCMALVERSTGRPIPIGVLAVSPMYWDTKIEDAVGELRELVSAQFAEP